MDTSQKCACYLSLLTQFPDRLGLLAAAAAIRLRGSGPAPTGKGELFHRIPDRPDLVADEVAVVVAHDGFTMYPGAPVELSLTILAADALAPPVEEQRA
jgi:hypothetical protein